MLSQKLSAKDYIEKFKEDAIKEMYLHKIPASIVLAQAMFESANGNSELAKNANNHFGIKCKRDWCGESYLKDDEEEKECFRKYNHVLESYSDHSIFLLTRPRYAFLFEIPLSDYKAWCYGLKDAGYATDPKYARKLIDIIEKFKLYEFDTYQSLTKPEFPSGPSEVENLALREVYRFNHVKFIITKEGDSFFKIASQFNIELEKLMEYNDIKKGESIQIGQKMFLEPKRSRAKEPYHVVQTGETLSSISQLHGIKLTVLCRNNRLNTGDELKTGDILYLRGKKPFRLSELLPEAVTAEAPTAGKY
jgi:LysM repeat protein